MNTSQGKPSYIPASWEKVSCPFCQSNNFRLYERYGSELQYTHVRCCQCRLVYQSPRPVYDQHFIDAAYANYYQYAENILPGDFDQIKHSGLNMFKKEIEHIMQYDRKKTNALDIGSGMGTFLYAAKPFYKTVVGIDVSAKMADFVKNNLGITVYLQQFEKFTYSEKFSLIHMSHVLEHVPNPNEWLQKAKNLLAINGILVINVPNKFSWARRFQHFLYRSKLKKQFSSSWKDPSRTPDHLFEPTIPSMMYLLKANGLDIIEYYTYSRRDPVSKHSAFSKLMNRVLKAGSNLAFITTPKKT